MNNNIGNSIKLDYYILKSSDFRRILIVSAAAILVGVLTKNPPIILGIIMMISGFFMSVIFAVVEKNNLDKLYGVLPVKKQQTVIGRYLFTFVAGIVIAVLASILTLVVSLILKIEVGSFAITVWLCGSFLLFCLLVSLQFPLYFKYDFSKLAALANLPYILVLIAGAYLVKKDATLFTQAGNFFTQNPYMVWVITVAGALLLLGISMVISIGFYKNRE